VGSQVPTHTALLFFFVDFPVRSRSLLRKHRAPNFVFAVARFRCRVKARHGRSFRRGARFLQRASQFTVGFDPTARAGITVRGTVSRFPTSFSLRDPSSCVAVSSVQYSHRRTCSSHLCFFSWAGYLSWF
jgi:hypothetical protein